MKADNSQAIRSTNQANRNAYFWKCYNSKGICLRRESNRLFAWLGHVTLSIIKNGHSTEQMPEMKKTCQNYESGQVWASYHSRVSFYGSLNCSEIWRICMEKINIAGEQTLLTNNISYTNLCNFLKIQTPIKIHSLMPGVSNLTIWILSTSSFYFCRPFCVTTVFHDWHGHVTMSCKEPIDPALMC